MIRIQDIKSLTDFHRNTKAHIKCLKSSGRPEVLTINGKAVLVVQDAAAYQRLLERFKKASRKNTHQERRSGQLSPRLRSRGESGASQEKR